MSCRIDRLVKGDRVILRISGRITGRNADMLRALLEKEVSSVAIDLKDVLLVDSEAVKLLAVTETNGAELRNCPAYIREWVTREMAETDAGQSEQKREGGEDVEDV
jgi:ABC-type transporter Mla MlaB component